MSTDGKQESGATSVPLSSRAFTAIVLAVVIVVLLVAGDGSEQLEVSETKVRAVLPSSNESCRSTVNEFLPGSCPLSSCAEALRRRFGAYPNVGGAV